MRNLYKSTNIPIAGILGFFLTGLQLNQGNPFMAAEKKKIFILDNSKAYTNILRTSLENPSIEIQTEREVSAALLKIIRWNPDLLITGVEVGSINGFDLCLILKTIPDFAALPIILMSSDDTDKPHRRAASAGADYYVHKNKELLENIKNGIDELLLKKDPGTQSDIEKSPVKKVLIVDDSSLMRRVIKNILISLNIENIFEAEDGRDGLKKLDENPVDMVMADISMPIMNGIEFVKNIRKNSKFKNLPVVLVTAEGAEEIEKAMAAGSDGYLSKPFSVQSMKNLVAKFASNVRPAN